MVSQLKLYNPLLLKRQGCQLRNVLPATCLTIFCRQGTLTNKRVRGESVPVRLTSRLTGLDLAVPVNLILVVLSRTANFTLVNRRPAILFPSGQFYLDRVT